MLSKAISFHKNKSRFDLMIIM